MSLALRSCGYEGFNMKAVTDPIKTINAMHRRIMKRELFFHSNQRKRIHKPIEMETTILAGNVGLNVIPGSVVG
jgi:hypothetical protein